MTMTNKPLAGKNAFVTGAGHPDGIGRACALALVTAGARVIISDLEASAGLDSFSAQCLELGGEGAAICCDVTDSADVARAVAEAAVEYDGLHILVNSAGVGIGHPDFLETTDKEWDITFAVNVRGTANVCKAAIPYLRDNEAGSIVNIASLSGLGAINGIPACYTASKFAVVGFTKQIALQLAPDNIHCNAVCPGSVRTQMMVTAMEALATQENISVEEAEKLEASGIPKGRAALPEEIAEVVLFLAADQSGYMTGAALPVAGGMSPGV